jgi:hypothetical protein
MFRMPSIAVRELDPAYMHDVDVTPSRRMRERVIGSVRGERTAAGKPAGDGFSRLLAPLVALVLGVILGGGLVLALSDGGRTGSAGGTHGAEASLRRVGTRAELNVSGMAEPPAGEVYEVWLVRSGAKPQPTDALFTVTRAGTATVEVPGALQRGVTEALVSSEPLGGSKTPTSPPILRVRTPGTR